MKIADDQKSVLQNFPKSGALFMRLIVEVNDRKVYWDLDENVGAILLSTLVQSIGPADGDI